ncbi:MAG: 3-isopropylmalate dehydratase small subunit [Candidatus Lokiarchaeota archaeon]|nr:3-isopropylmalate dehydratase small subunit [Candidatus Lokiarchaeota archaeon]
MIGKVIKYDKKDINTDLIIPARYLTLIDPDYLAKHCMEDLDDKFIQNQKKFGYSIMVAGSNFGCGSSREQAPIALKAAGINCIIAPSFARIFFRNAINIGLPIIEFENIEMMKTDDDLEICFTEGIIKNISTKIEVQIRNLPSFLQDIISVNGLINYARNKILKDIRT